jgi:hypothetical protein
MKNTIIRLFTADNLGRPAQPDKFYDFINVIREKYSDELIAYFIRSKAGTLLFVNETLSLQEQAKAISFVKDEIEKCGIAETGILKKNFEYHCGGSCCKECFRYKVI